MEGIETTQGGRGDELAAPQELHQKLANVWNRADAVGGHGCRPEGELAPGEEIAGQAEPLDQGEENEPGEPVQFPRAFVASHEEDRQQVEKEEQNHHGYGKGIAEEYDGARGVLG